jgi:uncharacterized protein YjlB
MTGTGGSGGGPRKSGGGRSGAGRSGGSGGSGGASGGGRSGSAGGGGKGTTDLRERLRAEQLDAVSWSNDAGDRYGAHEHSYDKVIVVEAGLIRFGLPGRGGDAGVDLVLGDRLELPAGTSHTAIVGHGGVTCLEAHLPAGSLPDVMRRAAGDW